MINISGFGMSVRVTASNTFPNGFTVTEFADDADSIDSPDLDVTDTAMGLNGDLIEWNRAQSIEVSVNVITTSPADVNLEALLEANRVGKGKTSARDVVNLVATYPNGMVY